SNHWKITPMHRTRVSSPREAERSRRGRRLTHERRSEAGGGADLPTRGGAKPAGAPSSRREAERSRRGAPTYRREAERIRRGRRVLDERRSEVGGGAEFSTRGGAKSASAPIFRRVVT